jgi:hypothetical protein
VVVEMTCSRLMCHDDVLQDIPTIWWANAAATGASYAYAYGFQGPADDEGGDLPEPIRAALKVSSIVGWEGRTCAVESRRSTSSDRLAQALDWGSGKERGARRRGDEEEDD